MFNFKSSIKIGKESAASVLENMKAVDNVFDELNKELAEDSNNKLSVIRKVPFDFSFPDKNALTVDKKGSLDINVDGQLKTIGRWEQDKNGFPFTLVFSGERTDCWDVESLVAALSDVISSGQFWLSVEELKNKGSKNPL
ncbi:hypothetical protein [Serratia fonticola]